MKLFTLIRRELFYRLRRTLAALLAVAIASGALTAALTLLRLHDRSARALLAEREKQTAEAGAVLRDEMRKATLKLSFNLLILPEQVDLKQWYIDQGSTLTLPEAYGEKLVKSGIVSVQHILPMIQKRMVWPETGRNIVLIGTRGEATDLYKNPRAPLIQPVPEGTIVLGYELYHSLGIASNQTVKLMGREFRIHRLHEERGSKDDITMWIHLKDAQELLGMQGKISSLLALECLCVGADALDQIRAEVTGILPGTQVIEMGTKVIARAEARIRAGEETARQLEEEKDKQRQLQNQRQRFAALLVPLMLLLCGGWIGLLTFSDVRDRRGEIGMLRTIGFRTHKLLLLFFGKALLIGLAGGAFGYAAAALLCAARAAGMEGLSEADIASVWNLSNLLISMAGAVGLIMVASWIPALIAAQTDPADVLREE
jgi:ABC-type lipoprotein release transport system permease subunit